jgi:putative phosphoribosyl transferase
MTIKMFRDRSEAGRRVAVKVARLDLAGDVVVLGLPRGGVPVACEVALELGAPLDVLVVRKIGAPFDRELAVGAIAHGGIAVFNDSLRGALGLDERSLMGTLHREREELRRRERAYRGGKPPLDVRGKTVIIVDDGMATGATMEAAVLATRKLAPAEIVVAVPTSARDAVARIEAAADRVIALETPEPYYGVGAWYADFSQLGDQDVIAALERAAARAPRGAREGESGAGRASTERSNGQRTRGANQ